MRAEAVESSPPTQSSKSWARDRATTFAVGPKETWAKIAKQGTREFVVGKFGLAEQYLRKSIELAESAGVADERLINLQNSLTETLISEKKFSEADGWYRKSYDKIKQLKLETEPITLRTLTLHSLIVDGIGSLGDCVVERRNLVAVAKRIFGSDSPAYKTCMYDALDYAIKKNFFDEALDLHKQLKREFNGKACVNARLFACTVRLGAKAYDQIWLDKSKGALTIEILEDAARASAPFLQSESESVFHCYRMLVLTYYHMGQGDQAVRCSRILIKIVPSHSSWPNPFSQACMGSAYLALGQRYQNEKTAEAKEYYKKAVEHFSHAPSDFLAYDHGYWARVGLVQCNMALNDFDAASKVLMPIVPNATHSWYLNAIICDLLMRVADEVFNRGGTKTAQTFFARASSYLDADTKPPREWVGMARNLREQRDKLKKRLTVQ